MLTGGGCTDSRKTKECSKKFQVHYVNFASNRNKTPKNMFSYKAQSQFTLKASEELEDKKGCSTDAQAHMEAFLDYLCRC